MVGIKQFTDFGWGLYMSDDRKMTQIHVSRELLIFVVCLFGAPIACGPLYAHSVEHKPLSATALNICWVVIFGSIGLMTLAVLSQWRKTIGKTRGDGKSTSGWFLRNVAIGISLIVLGGGLYAMLIFFNIAAGFREPALIPAGAGLLLIGKLLAPASESRE
jgi:hypothetical protein